MCWFPLFSHLSSRRLFLIGRDNYIIYMYVEIHTDQRRKLWWHHILRKSWTRVRGASRTSALWFVEKARQKLTAQFQYREAATLLTRQSHAIVVIMDTHQIGRVCVLEEFNLGREHATCRVVTLSSTVWCHEWYCFHSWFLEHIPLNQQTRVLEFLGDFKLSSTADQSRWSCLWFRSGEGFSSV